MVFRNKQILCKVRSKGRLVTRGCMTTQVHKNIVKVQVITSVNVPRPPFSGTHATVFLFARNSDVDTDRGGVRGLDILTQMNGTKNE